MFNVQRIEASKVQVNEFAMIYFSSYAGLAMSMSFNRRARQVVNSNIDGHVSIE
jgi:hypothetical protein